MTLHTCSYGSELLFRIMTIYHSRRRCNRLQAFYIGNFIIAAFFSWVDTYMFEIMDLLIQRHIIRIFRMATLAQENHLS